MFRSLDESAASSAAEGPRNPMATANIGNIRDLHTAQPPTHTLDFSGLFRHVRGIRGGGSCFLPRFAFTSED